MWHTVCVWPTLTVNLLLNDLIRLYFDFFNYPTDLLLRLSLLSIFKFKIPFYNLQVVTQYRVFRDKSIIRNLFVFKLLFKIILNFQTK
jgi:hypothetical protein